MDKNVYNTVKEGRSCASTLETTYKNKKNSKLFLESGPIYFVTMDVLEPLLKTTLGRQYIVAITDLYLKVTREVTTSKKMA